MGFSFNMATRVGPSGRWCGSDIALRDGDFFGGYSFLAVPYVMASEHSRWNRSLFAAG